MTAKKLTQNTELSSNFPKKRKSKVNRNATVARLVGERLKNNVVICNKPMGKKWSPSLQIVEAAFDPYTKLPTWEHASDAQKRTTYLQAMRSLRRYTVVALSINLSDSTISAALRQKSMNHLRDTVQRVLKSHLPSDTPVLNFLIAETTTGGRLHLHGALALPNSLEIDETITKLTRALREKLAKKYKQRFKNKAVKLQHRYEKPRSRELESGDIHSWTEWTDISSKWGQYCNKSEQSVVHDGLLNTDITISTHLKQLAKAFWNLLKAIPQRVRDGLTAERANLSYP